MNSSLASPALPTSPNMLVRLSIISFLRCCGPCSMKYWTMLAATCRPDLHDRLKRICLR